MSFAGGVGLSSTPSPLAAGERRARDAEDAEDDEDDDDDDDDDDDESEG